ncbi:unnamed protein product, partial [Sphacelaria rigidula]
RPKELVAQNVGESEAAGGVPVNSAPTAAASSLKKEGHVEDSEQKAGARPHLMSAPHSTTRTSRPGEPVAQTVGETEAAGGAPVNSAPTAAASSLKKEGHVGDSEQKAGARAHAMSAPHSTFAMSRPKELAVPGRLTATYPASYPPAVIRNTGDIEAAGGVGNGAPTAAASTAKEEKYVKVSNQTKAAARAHAMSAPQPPMETSKAEELAAEIMEEIEAAGVGLVNSISIDSASSTKKERRKERRKLKEQEAAARAHAMSAPHLTVATSKAREPVAKNPDETEAAGRDRVDSISTDTPSSPKKKKLKKEGRVEVSQQNAGARAHVVTAPNPTIATLRPREPVVPGCLMFADPASYTPSLTQNAGETETARGDLVTSAPTATSSLNKEGHVDVSEQKTGVRAHVISAPHPTVATSRPGELAVPGRLTATHPASYTSAVKKLTGNTEAAGDMVNSAPTADTSTTMTSEHFEVSKQKKADARAHAMPVPQPLIATSKAQKLAAQKAAKAESKAKKKAAQKAAKAESEAKKKAAQKAAKAESKAKKKAAQKTAKTAAAGGGLVNSVPTSATSSPKQGGYVEVSERNATASAHAMPAPHPTVATSRPRELAGPGRVMVADLASYTPAVTQNTGDIKAAGEGVVNSAPTAPASSPEEKGHVEVSEQKAGARAPAVSASHHTFGTSRATEPAAQNTGKTEAAEGGPVNKVPTATASTTKKVKYVKLSEQKVGARAHAGAKGPTVLMVTNIASYTTAVKMFVPCAERIGAKTLMQACAGRAVVLGVVQESADDKITGAVTHIQ